MGYLSVFKMNYSNWPILLLTDSPQLSSTNSSRPLNTDLLDYLTLLFKTLTTINKIIKEIKSLS